MEGFSSARRQRRSVLFAEALDALAKTYGVKVVVPTANNDNAGMMLVKVSDTEAGLHAIVSAELKLVRFGEI